MTELEQINCACHVRRAVDAHQRAKRALEAYRQGYRDVEELGTTWADYAASVSALLEACKSLEVDPYDALREVRR